MQEGWPKKGEKRQLRKQRQDMKRMQEEQQYPDKIKKHLELELENATFPPDIDNGYVKVR